MNDFIEKWRNDNKYRAKIKLLLYLVFIIIVSIYAFSLSDNNNSNLYYDVDKDNSNKPNEESKSIINIPEEYKYATKININNDSYQYNGEVKKNKEIITKIVSDKEINYIYENNNYYLNNNGTYIKTSKDEVYDIVDYNYINLSTINTYLNQAQKNDNQYIIYLKDIILDNQTEDYFIIIVNNNKINIDYTPLMKALNKNVDKYTIDILIEAKENERGESNGTTRKEQ